jgi:dGTP triphosphohydrolase
MKKMSDQVKYQLERAEDALRSALMMLDSKESVYVISSISKALIEIDNTLFVERIEEAAKKGNSSAQGLISVTKEEKEDGRIQFNFNYSDEGNVNL